MPVPGAGGSGILARHVLDDLARLESRVHALGPPARDRSLGPQPVVWYDPPEPVAVWRHHYTWLRWYTGRLEVQRSRGHGQWAAHRMRAIKPAFCYAFAEVGLESLQWAARNGVTTILDSPSGNIRHFHGVVTREYRRWCGVRARVHPTSAMVDRVEEEYRSADRIRAASTFTRRSMIMHGVPAEKISIVPYPLDLARFTPRSGSRGEPSGPLRVCYVGMLAMHKGWVYLLRAARLLGRGAVSLRLIGGTFDRHTSRLLREQREGITVVDGPADDVATELHQAEVLVLPSLHDGFGFVVVEAMAAGLPVVVTDQTGAADWVVQGQNGWVVRSGDEEALAAALQTAIDQRPYLRDMGRAAQRTAAALGGSGAQFREWVFPDGVESVKR